jgi:hypothetical protein
VISGLAVWQLIRWFALESLAEGEVSDDELDNQLIITFRPMSTFSNKFGRTRASAAA